MISLTRNEKEEVLFSYGYEADWCEKSSFFYPLPHIHMQEDPEIVLKILQD